MLRAVKRCILAVLLPCMFNFILLFSWAYGRMSENGLPPALGIGGLSIVGICFAGIYLGLLVMPAFDRVRTGLRVRMMLGG